MTCNIVQCNDAMKLRIDINEQFSDSEATIPECKNCSSRWYKYISQEDETTGGTTEYQEFSNDGINWGAVGDGTPSSVYNYILIDPQTYSSKYYTVSASSTISPYFSVSKMFDDDTTPDSAWMSEKKYNNNGDYIGSNITGTGPSSFRGEWIQFEFFNLTVIKRLRITPYSKSLVFSPRNIRFYGANTPDGTWTMVYGELNIQYSNNQDIKEFVFDNNKDYKFYRLVINAVKGNTSINENNACTIQKLELFTSLQATPQTQATPTDNKSSQDNEKTILYIIIGGVIFLFILILIMLFLLKR